MRLPGAKPNIANKRHRLLGKQPLGKPKINKLYRMAIGAGHNILGFYITVEVAMIMELF